MRETGRVSVKGDVASVCTLVLSFASIPPDGEGFETRFTSRKRAVRERISQGWEDVEKTETHEYGTREYTPEPVRSHHVAAFVRRRRRERSGGERTLPSGIRLDGCGRVGIRLREVFEPPVAHRVYHRLE